MFKRILLVAIILATVCVSASADYVWFAFNGSLGPTDTLTGWTDTFTIPKFNPALGTLDSIEFTMVSDLLGMGDAENMHPTMPAIVSVRFNSAMTLTRPDATTLIAAAPIPARYRYLSARMTERRITSAPTPRISRVSPAG